MDPRADPAPRRGAARAALLIAAGLLVLAALAAAGMWLARGGDPPTRYGVPRRPAAQRLLVVGWDGATWNLIDPLLQQGRLPNLARLIARGSSARLESTIVPISSAAWVGAVTGRQPGETGVYGFFEPVEDTYDVRLVSARSNRATPLWRILMRHGMRSVVFGMPLTYPPEPIDGVMVSGMLAPRDADYAWPPGFAERLRARGFQPDLGVWRDEDSLSKERIRTQLALKRDVLLELLAEEDWDLFFPVFKELDVLGHHAYDGRTDTAVAALYELLDAILGELVDAAGPEANVLVLSDHGFASYEQFFHPHTWLVQEGFAVRKPGFVPAQAALGPLGERRATEHRRLLDELDLERTRALAGTCEGRYGGIRLNLAGREPRGIVPPEEAEALLAEIEARLRAMVVPGSGVPLVTRVFRGEELYPGPERDEIPDLLFETAPGLAVFSGPGVGLFERPPQPLPDHERTGVLVAAGPALAGVRERGDAAIFDVAPTVLHLLGLPVYAQMDGRALVELLREPVAPRVVDETTEPFHDVDPWRGRGGFSEREQEEVRKRLHQTGYAE